MPSCSLIPLEFHVADLTVLLESLPQSSSSPSTTTTTITLPFEIRVLEREWLGDAVPRVGRREETEMIRTLGFRDALYEVQFYLQDLESVWRLDNHEIHEVMTKHCSHSV